MAAKKRFADIKHQVIQAVLGGHYSFADAEQAKKQLNIIKSQYFVSKHPDLKDTDDSCTIWVRGFDITEEEKNKGSQGNFLKIHCVKTDPKSYGFFHKKVDVDIAVHPQRKRILQRHPNWGHPILRSIEKKRLYPTVENAQAELTALQQEYPHAAIPGPNKLFLMIFGRTDDNKKRVKKYVLEIKLADKNSYYIECTENSKKPAKKKTAPPAAKKEDNTSPEPVGSFTAKLALKRNKKKK